MALGWRSLFGRWFGQSIVRWSGAAGTSATETAIYFHEDDYCQSQLLPLSALANCRKQLAEIHRFADAHRAEGAGYTDIYLRKEGPAALADLQLASADVERLLSSHLACHRLITTGYGSIADPVPRVVAFGAGQLACVFVHFNEAGLVLEIFTQFRSMQPPEMQRMHAALSDLSGTAELLLVDWEDGDLLALTDREALHKYISRARAVSDSSEA
jgi:hypothetical protein